MIPFFLHEESVAQILLESDRNSHAVSSLAQLLYNVTSSGVLNLKFSADIYEMGFGESDFSSVLFRKYEDDCRDSVLQIQRSLDAVFDQQVTDTAVAQLNSCKGGVLITNFSGASNIETISWSVKIWKVEQMAKAIQLAFVELGLKEPNLSVFLKLMFPNLHFHVEPSFAKMKLTFVDSIHVLMRHLSWLDNAGCDTFEGCSDFGALVKYASAAGIDMSTESPKTRANISAMRKRFIEVAGESLCCDWHTKLSYDKGRIHFYPWMSERPPKVASLAGRKLIIGIFVDHLPT